MVRDSFHIGRDVILQSGIGGMFALAAFFISYVLPQSQELLFSTAWPLIISFLCFIGFGVHLPVIAAILDRTSLKAEVVDEGGIQEFERVLKDTKEVALLGSFLELEFSSENIQFYISTLAWEDNYHSVGVKNSFLRGKKLVNLFVANSAVLAVNLPWKARNDLMNAFNGSPEELTPEVFNVAREEVKQLMFRDSYRRFLVWRKSEGMKMVVNKA